MAKQQAADSFSWHGFVCSCLIYGLHDLFAVFAGCFLFVKTLWWQEPLARTGSSFWCFMGHASIRLNCADY